MTNAFCARWRAAEYWVGMGALACLSACTTATDVGDDDVLDDHAVESAEQAVIPGATIVQAAIGEWVRGNRTRTILAECPTDTVVVGGGYRVSSIDLRVRSSHANPGQNRWEVIIQNFSTTDLTAAAYAECLSGTEARIVAQNQQGFGIPPGGKACATSSCSSPSFLVSGGFRSTSNAFKPYTSYGVSLTNWEVCGENLNSFQTIDVVVTANCLGDIGGGRTKPKTPVTSLPPGYSTFDSPTCPSGTLLHMGGLETWGPPEPIIVGSYRKLDPPRWSWRVYNDTQFEVAVVGYPYCLDLWTL